MGRRKKRSEDPIREPEVPTVIHFKPVSNSDLSLVMALKETLEARGVIDRDGKEAAELTTDDSVEDILSEATALAKHEKELNSDFYNEEVDDMVSREGERAKNRQWVNPNVAYEDDY